ncbi:(2Fe-2S)-binding protein [Streptomyces sp. BE303]|uniref:(2Fe-2S)-binding protein n=1 Tax=Streptomyces sp. BE303 TaxID=3002528 RepID=UPI002E770FD1|nr:(2Fe-2S)-binding protein [Streptomyces sp. BE303]MED7952997.1 (2Fe-2S)-binding protein [Streptomyces sp. BE303]
MIFLLQRDWLETLAAEQHASDLQAGSDPSDAGDTAGLASRLGVAGCCLYYAIEPGNACLTCPRTSLEDRLPSL